MALIDAKDKPVKPLPFPIYYGTVILLALAGLANSIYLAVSHYRVYTDIGYRSFCAISKAINCDTVSQSSYSVILNIPVPVWGVIGYTFLILFLILSSGTSLKQGRAWSLAILIAAIFCCISIGLALILTTFINSYCIMCILSYGINFALLYLTALSRRRFAADGFIHGLRQDVDIFMKKKMRSAFVFLPFLIIVGIGLVNFPAYWNVASGADWTDIPRGITKDGHPWIGAEFPDLTIVEFSDYLCFQCKKMHYFLRQMVAQNPQKIRLVHYHFPMDHEVNIIVKEPFHVGAGKMALTAIYAASQGKFWEMNDLLFNLAGKEKQISLKKLAARTGLESDKLARAINSQSMRRRLKVDIWTALRLRMTGTPSFLVNGRVYQGQLPPEVFKNILN
jgi:protein-disulfide isomerase/uncharacterized membrane protein